MWEVVGEGLKELWGRAQGKSVPCRGNSGCKGLGAGVYVAELRGRGQRSQGTRLCMAWEAIVRTWAFPSVRILAGNDMI